MARIGPQLRSPTGGYFATAASRPASSASLIIGAMIASAPKSSARDTRAKSLCGTRTIGAAPAWLTAPAPATSEETSQRPCCASSTTAAKPSRAIASATTGDPIMHQAPYTVSPARRRRARAKAGTSAALLDLRDRLRQQLSHLQSNLLLGNALRLQVLDDLVRDVFVAAFEVGKNDFLSVGFRVRAAFAQNSGRPEPEHLVAAGHRLETELLVMRELLFEAFFALVECRGHTVLVTAIAKIACTCSLLPPCISSATRQGNIGALFYGEN